MEFNIKDYIQKIKEKSIQSQPEVGILEKILKGYVLDINVRNISLNKGILSLKNISPSAKTFIKTRKKEILYKLKEHNLFVHDII